MAKRKIGGGWFSSTDPLTGATSRNWSNIFITIITVLVVLGVIVLILMLVLRHPKESEPAPSGGGAVAPMSNIPGPLTIAEVAQAPSAGQAIIYFSQDRVAGAACDTCTAQFDINLSYSGGQPTPGPIFRTVTAPSTSGVVTFDYSVSGSGFSPLTPGGSTSTPPNQVGVKITARSISSQDPTKKGSPTSFSKTIPYVA